jgi:hypothetical protein
MTLFCSGLLREWFTDCFKLITVFAMTAWGRNIEQKKNHTNHLITRITVQTIAGAAGGYICLRENGIATK